VTLTSSYQTTVRTLVDADHNGKAKRLQEFGGGHAASLEKWERADEERVRSGYYTPKGHRASRVETARVLFDDLRARRDAELFGVQDHIRQIKDKLLRLPERDGDPRVLELRDREIRDLMRSKPRENAQIDLNGPMFDLLQLRYGISGDDVDVLHALVNAPAAFQILPKAEVDYVLRARAARQNPEQWQLLDDLETYARNIEFLHQSARQLIKNELGLDADALTE
jgi:hypothetical protein